MRSNCNFSNEQAESTYFRQFAKMDNIFFDSKLNLRRNSGRPNERTRGTVWCQIARTFDKNKILLKVCFKKKPFAVYICVSVHFGGAPHKKLPEENYRFEIFKNRIPESIWTDGRAHGRTDGRTKMSQFPSPKHPPKNKNLNGMLDF